MTQQELADQVGVSQRSVSYAEKQDWIKQSTLEKYGQALGRPDFTMRPGEGIAGRVIEEGIVINVRDTHTDSRYLRLGVAIHLRSLLVAPVQSGSRRLGTLSASSAAPRTFSADDEELFTTLGVQAALAIENARLFEVERRRAEEAEALQRVTQTLISRLNLSEMLEVVVATRQGGLFAWNTRSTACSSKAFAPSPKTVSVGYATRPPRRRRAMAVWSSS